MDELVRSLRRLVLVVLPAMLFLAVGVLWFEPRAGAAPATFNVEVISVPPSVVAPDTMVTIVWRITGDQNVGINKVYYGGHCDTPPSCYANSTPNQPGGPGVYSATLTVNGSMSFRVLAGTGLETKYTPEYSIRAPSIYLDSLEPTHCYPRPGETIFAAWTIDTVGLPLEAAGFRWDTVSRYETHAYRYAPGDIKETEKNRYQAMFTAPGGVEGVYGAAYLDVNGWRLWSREGTLSIGRGRFLRFHPFPRYVPRGKSALIGWDFKPGRRSLTSDYRGTYLLFLLYDTVSHAGEPLTGDFPLSVYRYVSYDDLGVGNPLGGDVWFQVPTEGERLYFRSWTRDAQGCIEEPASPEMSLPIGEPLSLRWRRTPDSPLRGTTITVTWEVYDKATWVDRTYLEADYTGWQPYTVQYQSPPQAGPAGHFTAEVPVPPWAQALVLRPFADDGHPYYGPTRTLPLKGEFQTATPTPDATWTPTPTSTSTLSPTNTSTRTPTVTGTAPAAPTASSTSTPLPTGTPIARPTTTATLAVVWRHLWLPVLRR